MPLAKCVHRFALFACSCTILIGCTSPRYELWPADLPREHAVLPADADNVRELPAFDGEDAAALDWQHIIHAIGWADVVIVGEQHDDAVGHKVQLAVVEDVLDRWPDSALSMEMLTRDHQIYVDDYLDGIIDARALVRLAGIADWAGPDTWNEWYQPIVDAATKRGGRVIAANAPRRYVRVARVQGYDALRVLPRERRALFDLPGDHDETAYRDRFFDIMAAMGDSHAPDDEDEAEESQERSEAAHHHHHMDDSHLQAMFRSQLLWDATMARSIVNARPTRTRKVIHLCGRFHSDFEGGTVLELRRHRPMLRALTISMVREESTMLRKEDQGRADIVIYTGEPESEPEPDEADHALQSHVNAAD